MYLGIDTSTSFVSLALGRVSEHGLIILEETVEGPPHKQSHLLPRMIEQALDRQGVAATALQGMAVGLGPGSFTGLRVGLATIKGLAYAAKIRVAGVSSLAAVASRLFADRPTLERVAVVAVARRAELYVAVYERRPSGVEACMPPLAAMIPEVPKVLAPFPEIAIAGPGLDDSADALIATGVTAPRLIRGEAFPRGGHVLSLALPHFERDYRPETLFSLEPHYVKPSGAEENPKFPPLPGPAPAARMRED